MMAYDAVVLEHDGAVGIVDWGNDERISDSHSPVLPTGVNVVVVVVVTPAYLLGNFVGVIPVHRTALILGIEVFIDHSRHERIFRQSYFHAPQSVFPLIVEEHH